ncbi:ethyl tert-butyl ether degradation EthD [Caballeronia novacaledonica]|uniref:Ethyl tert-butyl ether degradation EthD n=1 Tax=Caballeronia novacaledonica TaxID=1544861 RepID=A0A2U3I387_9BURK|nr:EthD family reductase [Caballeronia novacaledonica]SPB14529.1 ethyl tert-butyl ether degradation EthD [Caballeronia novacaledonica]
MSQQPGVTIYVTYEGGPGARFDRAYYVHHHLPLVMRHWSQYGLESVAAFFPAVAQAGTLAICECCFRDEASVAASFASPEAAEVMADLPHFTDLAAHRSRAMPI